MPETKDAVGKYGLIRLRVFTPSNGSEGDWWDAGWCNNCKHQNPTGNEDEGCLIAFMKRITEPKDDGHPAEWVTIPGGISICTAFEAKSPEALETVQTRVWATATHQMRLAEQEKEARPSRST